MILPFFLTFILAAAPFLNNSQEVEKELQTLNKKITIMEKQLENYTFRVKKHNRKAWDLEFQSWTSSREEQRFADELNEKAENLKKKLCLAYKYKKELEDKSK